MDERVNDAIQERLEKESKELEAMCCCSEPSTEQRLKWVQNNQERLERSLRNSNNQVEVLMDLFANDHFQRTLDKEHIIELRTENKRLNENAWKLKELLLDPENKIRISKEMSEKVFKLLP